MSLGTHTMMVTNLAAMLTTNHIGTGISELNCHGVFLHRDNANDGDLVTTLAQRLDYNAYSEM